MKINTIFHLTCIIFIILIFSGCIDDSSQQVNSEMNNTTINEKSNNSTTNDSNKLVFSLEKPPDEVIGG